MNILKLTVPLLSLVVSITGCAVEPWQRGNLAKSHMALDPYPLQNKLRGHNYTSREASPAAGSSGSGGGCGCY